MSFSAQCPHCHKHVTAPDEAEGKRLNCPHCQKPFAVGREARAGAAAARVTWEYRVEDVLECDDTIAAGGKTLADKKRLRAVPVEKRLNAMGAEGWELTGSSYAPAESRGMTDELGFWRLIFKRPKPIA
jgi:endogenous inhibitor of DNA gyrase (YacG/DUF329 family)